MIIKENNRKLKTLYITFFQEVKPLIFSSFLITIDTKYRNIRISSLFTLPFSINLNLSSSLPLLNRNEIKSIAHINKKGFCVVQI